MSIIRKLVLPDSDMHPTDVSISSSRYCYTGITSTLRYILLFYSFLICQNDEAIALGNTPEPRQGLANNNSIHAYTNSVGATMTTPNLTVRFTNPAFDCLTGEYCVDVEFQSDLPDQELFGMNVRFFYEESKLELINFRDFQGGYGPVAPNPPVKLTSLPAFGYNYFRFGVPGNGAAEWINGAIQLVDESQPPLYISTTGWTKLFQICFEIDDPNPDSTGFCPPLVWDLEQNPALGGYLPGDDGVVMTVFEESTGFTLPTFEHVDQFNWEYTGTGSAPPYGAPVPTDCTPISCGIHIVCPADITIGCGGSTLPANTGIAISDDQCPGTPVITFSDVSITGNCSEGSQIVRTWMVTDSCSNQDTCVQIITIDDRGSICGTVFNDLSQPMGGVELRLLADVNMNQTVDAGDILQSTVYSDPVTGAYCFNQVYPCAYIIQEIQPLAHGSLSDYDATADPDGDDSIDGPDNEIPVLLSPCEVDLQNNFVDIVCPTTIPSLPPDTLCENEPIILQITDLNIGLLTYSWDFGSGAMPSGGFGLGPHEVSYISTTENQSDGVHVNLTISKAGCPDTTTEACILQVNPFPDATINGSTAQGCYYTNRIFQPMQAELPGATYYWNFGTDAVPAAATGYGPHTVHYTSAGTKVVSLSVLPNDPGAQCNDSATLSFQIVTCLSQIVGTVTTNTNEPIPGVNLRLYPDANTDGIPDTSLAVRSVFSTSVGQYSMASLIPGHYVIVEIQPSGWVSFDDGDNTNDGDIVENIDSLDNLIPVSLFGGETDGVNYFMETALPGIINGNVFIDADNDQVPDSGEGMPDVVISIYHDNNLNGVADSNIPVFSQTTVNDGSYSFINVPVGNYVIAETQPIGHTSVKDFDASNDGDLVLNTNILNDTIPVTVTNVESDNHNYFIEKVSCNLTVTNTNDSGSGSFRQALACAVDGDTIRFDQSLSGATITITSGRIAIDKYVTILSDMVPRITLSSEVSGFFDIAQGAFVEFRGVNIISGLTGNGGAAFSNQGSLTMHDVSLLRNPSLPTGEYLLYNHLTSQLSLRGSCYVEMN